jgi:branched-chain amino acid transport system ATP-binding protein
MPERLLEVRDLRAAYEGKEALHGVSVDVDAGEVRCLIGPNGAGKTTLMCCLAGLMRPTAGHIVLAGRDVTALPAAERVELGLVLVPEGRRVFAPLTVRENLEMGAFRRLWPRRRASLEDDLDRVFALFPHLRERVRQEAGTLSGGEQQMLALGRALMARPRLLLLDEPSMGLAPLVVRDIFASLRALAADGLPMLIGEQNARMALRSAARGSVIAEGRIVREDGAEALLSDPGVQEAYLGI